MIYHDISLDLSYPRGVNTIYVKYRSTGQFLRAKIFKNGAAYNLSDYDISNIKIYSGQNVNGVSATQMFGNEVIFNIDSDSGLYTAGWVMCAIEMIKTEMINGVSTLTSTRTQNFQIFSEDMPAPYADSPSTLGGFSTIDASKLYRLHGELGNDAGGFALGAGAETDVAAIQLGAGTNTTSGTLQVYNKTLLGADGIIPNERLLIDTSLSTDSVNTVQNKVVTTEVNLKAYKKYDTNGGGAIGESATALLSGGAVGKLASSSDGGGAVGYSTSATSGGAVGNYAAETSGGGAIGETAIAELGGGAVGYSAKSTGLFSTGLFGGGAVGYEAESTGGGGAVGYEASASTGGAVGKNSQATTGGAVGNSSQATTGGAVGDDAFSLSGGAVGNSSTASSGGAVGDDAAETSGGGAVGYTASTQSGGAVGNTASSTTGGSIGNIASSTTGGAVGNGAKTSIGFAGGYNAKTVSAGSAIDAIQLGTGTNANAKTLQVYTNQLLDSSGKIPNERFPDNIRKIESVTASANELNILKGATLSTAELNYVKGVTSGIQGQLDGKALSSHDHSTLYSPIGHNHNDSYSGINHNHNSDYATIGHGHSAATTDVDGFFSASDKTKLDKFTEADGELLYDGEAIAQDITIDSELSNTSENPVQNKVIYDALGDKSDTSHAHDNTALIYTTMPTAATALVGKIVQFSGATDANYTHGFFYECKLTGEVCAWEEVVVGEQPANKDVLDKFSESDGALKYNGEAISLESTVNLTNLCFLTKTELTLQVVFDSPENASDSAEGAADGALSVLLDGGGGGAFIAKSAGTILFFNSGAYESQTEIVEKGEVLYVAMVGNTVRYTEAQLLDLYMS